MRPTLCRFLVCLYPQTWQERYGEEFSALLEQIDLHWSDCFDLLMGAWDAHLNQWGVRENRWRLMNALRNHLLVIFCAYALFVLAGLGLLGMVDDSPLAELMKSQAIMTAAWDILAFASALSALAAITAVLPAGWNVLRESFTRRKGNLLLLAVPVVAFLLLALYLGLIMLSSLGILSIPGLPPVPPNSRGIPQPYATLLPIADGLLLIATVISLIAICLVVLRTDIREMTVRFGARQVTLAPYRLALVPAIIVMFLMRIMFAATLLWGWVAYLKLPSAFTGYEGLLGMNTLLNWWLVVGLMGVSTFLAVWSVSKIQRIQV